MPDEQIRIAIATAFIQAGVTSDDGPGLFEWHPCVDRPNCHVAQGKGPCACSGMPYLNDDTWAAIRYGLGDRLLPDGGETRTEWTATAWTDADNDSQPPRATRALPSSEAAAEWAAGWIVAGGYLRLWHRERREWPDGTVLTGPWVEVTDA